MSDQLSYDIAAFARSFTWALLHWNSAEHTAKLILAQLLGDTKPALAIVSDLGNRSLLQGIEAAARELDEASSVKSHLTHLCAGFGTMLGYRNLYVHNLKAVKIEGRTGSTVSLSGHLYQLKGGGRLPSVVRNLSIEEIKLFREQCRQLNSYANAILTELDPGVAAALGLPPSSLERPSWPTPLQNIPNYHQA